MSIKTATALLSATLLLSGACTQDQGRDIAGPGVSPADTTQSSQAAGKANVPDTGFGHIGANGQNDAGGSFGGIH